MPNILASIEKIVKENVGDIEISTDLSTFLSKYKSKSLIYPSVLIRKFKLPNHTIYQILSDLEDAGYLQTKYELYCGLCHKHIGTGQLYDTIALLPTHFTCEECDEEFLSMNNAILIYMTKW